MENAADAFKMAGFILMFVIALSVAITAFSQARATSDIILSYSDRETSYISGDENYYYVGNNNQIERTVGVETIVPSIYRASVENYKIIFKLKDKNYYLYEDNDGNKENTIDPEVFYNKVYILNNADTEEFLNGILFGAANNDKNSFESKFKVKLNSESLYEKIKGKTFKESLGIYNQSDIDIENTENNSDIENLDKTDRNKIIKRVITYEEQ